jgi:MFS transporter, PPP family, 3-phenylpropionic acid transporter
MNSPLFTKLSFSYFAYFGILGLIVPYLSVFLDGRHYSSMEIGEILAIFTATKIIGPTLWAMLADKSGKQLSIIQLGSGLALLSFTLLFWMSGYWPVTFALALFSLFWTAILPQLEVMTMTSIRRSAKIYARIRLWGSVGFIVLAVIAGKVIEQFSSEAFTYIGWLILLALFLSSLRLKQPRAVYKKSSEDSSLLSRLLLPSFILFFISGLLLQVSFGPYYSFFALFLRDLAYPSYAVGLFISLGVVAEIGVFFIAGRLYQLFGARLLIAFSFLVTAIRWYLTGNFADNVIILFLAQLLHAASFGLYHSASIQFVQQHFQSNQQNRGQAIYIAGVYGVGGAIGAYVSGYLWKDGFGAVQSFEFAAIMCLIASGLACFIVTKK